MPITQIELPDFDDMERQIEVLAKLLREKLMLDLQIRDDEARMVKILTTDPQYFVGGKPPSMSYIETTFMIKGLDGNLYNRRVLLAELTAQYERQKLLYELSKMKVDVWRSQSANQRMSVA
jgi:hypothetical protein